MKPKTILLIIGVLVLITGVLPLIKSFLPQLIPTEGIIYQAIIILLGIIGIIAGLSKKIY